WIGVYGTILSAGRGSSHRRSCGIHRAITQQHVWVSGFGLLGAALAVGRGRDGLVHDPANGAGAAAALGAAAQTAVDLACRARRRLHPHRRADILVCQYVAGADDHGWPYATIDTARHGG